MNETFDTIPSNLFTYHPPTKTFSTESSELNGFDFLQRSYHNSTNRGFSMKSTKTGFVVPFYFVGKLWSNDFEGTFIGWKFTCDWDDSPTRESYTVLIIND